jgi:hypothetical protein
MTDLEKVIVSQVKKSIGEVIVSSLGHYDSPLKKLVGDVFEEQRDEVSSIVKSVMSEVLAGSEFRATLKEEFRRKISKFLVGTMEGQVKKAVDILKQDPTFKSRMILAMDGIVEAELTSLNRNDESNLLLS